MAAVLSRRTMLGGAITSTALAGRTVWAAEMTRVLSPAATSADVALLRRAYETLHPGLLRYQSASESARRFDALAAACTRPMTLAAFYLLLSRFLATVRCGHTYANFFNQSAGVRAILFDAPGRLPLEFRWLGTHMVVTADPFATGIEPGSEVLSIDGRPAAEVLAAMMGIARADGHNDAKRRRLLSVQNDDAYETFDIFYPLLFGERSRFRLVVVGPDGRRRRADLTTIDLAARRARQATTGGPLNTQPAWTLEQRGRFAVLTMSTWGLYDTKWDWRNWLDESLDALAREYISRLVVDLRANEGGLDDCAYRLAERLLRRPATFDTARRLVRYRRVPADLLTHLDTWDHRFDDWGAAARPHDSRFLELTGEQEGWKTIVPRGPRFKGELVVLTGPQNSSATFSFAQLMRREGRAMLVGEPTGGNRRGINGSAFYFVRLPGTGLEVDLPLVGLFPLGPEPDAGLLPDRLIVPTRDDIAMGRDPILAAVMNERPLSVTG